MRCPFCDADKDNLKVIDSRTTDDGRSIRRRRECVKCARRFTTYERIEERQRMSVVKKDGRRIPWDREKVRRGLERACFKRPVAESELLRICDEVEDETFKAHDREVDSDFIGRLVSEKLRRVDQVAYVRFASVYRQFKTLEELVAEARAVLDARHFEDPGQGKLFLEDGPRSPNRPRPAEAASQNGAEVIHAKRGRKKRSPSPPIDTDGPAEGGRSGGQSAAPIAATMAVNGVQ